MRARTALVVLAAGTVACATTLREEARRATESELPTASLIEALRSSHQAIGTTKRIFGVTLVEGRRRFGGEGALVYQAEPRRLRADVFGAHDTPVLHVRLRDDRLTVRLPRDGETLTGELGDPRFARLTGERALVSAEMLGALLGAYDVDRLLADAERVVAAAEEGRRTLYILEDATIHALTLGSRERLVEYRQARDGRLLYRVRFEEFHEVDGRASPWHVVLRDFARDRFVVVDVRSERSATEDDFEIG